MAPLSESGASLGRNQRRRQRQPNTPGKEMKKSEWFFVFLVFSNQCCFFVHHEPQKLPNAPNVLRERNRLQVEILFLQVLQKLTRWKASEGSVWIPLALYIYIYIYIVANLLTELKNWGRDDENKKKYCAERKVVNVAVRLEHRPGAQCAFSHCSCSHAFILNSRYETSPKTERTSEGTVS